MSKFDAIRRALKTGDELGLQRAYSRALVKGLDTSPEARLARARAQGFDVETPLYRGLQEPFDPAKASKYGGEFYTPDPDIARNYALWTGRVDDGPNTMPVFAKPPTVTEDWGGATYSDPAKRLTGETEQVQEFRYGPAAILDLFAPKYVTQDVTRPDWRPTHRSADKFVKAAAAEGAPVVRVDNVYDSGGKQSQTYVADPTARRSVFAMFDPARAGRSDIMAGVIPATAAVGAGALAPQDAEAAPRIPKGITAYHGSPHTFDRFDMSKIGTGEGAQAYGHGLYFAGDENIARHYRRELSQGFANDVWEKSLERALIEAGAPPSIARGTARGPGSDAYSKTYFAVAGGADPEEAIAQTLAGVRGATPEDAEIQRAVLRSLSRNPDLQKAVGSMYQVRLNVEPDQLLDWDAPLSAQPESVQKAFAGVEQAPNIPGQLAYYRLAGQTTGKKTVSSPETSARLLEAGIPGLKYLDANSRAAGEGTRNYVMFDDKLVDILKRYGIAAGATGVGAAAVGAPQEAQAQTLQTPQPSALARALARQLQGSYNKREAAQAQQALGDRLDRVISNEQRRALQATGGRVDRSGEFVRQMATPEGLNYLADTALDAAGWVDPSGGFATETVRALKDLPSKVGIGGAISLAPVVGASEMNGGIGQLPFVAYEAAKSSPRALARALARPAQPRGSQTYRKAK